ALLDQGLEVLEAIGAGQMDRSAELGHLRLDGAQPGRVAPALQQAIALAHGLFVVAYGSGVGRDEGRYQPVEKAPAITGRSREETIHGRGEPEHAQIIAHRLDG